MMVATGGRRHTPQHKGFNKRAFERMFPALLQLLAAAATARGRGLCTTGAGHTPLDQHVYQRHADSGEDFSALENTTCIPTLGFKGYTNKVILKGLPR